MNACDTQGHLWTHHIATDYIPRHWTCNDCGTVDVP